MYTAYLKRQSQLLVYPIPTYVVPALFVTTLLINTFGRTERKSLTPRILFYTGIDGRDLYSDIGVGANREGISETFGFVRLDSEGRPLEQVKLTSALPLVVTGHCVLPRETAYKPDVIIFDTNGFNVEALVRVMVEAQARWPAALTYGVTGDPLTPFISIASLRKWAVIDLLREALPAKDSLTGHDPFARVAIQLANAGNKVRHRLEVPAQTPAPAWTSLRDVVDLAKRHTKTLATARQFLALVKWLCGLSVLPSEFEDFRLTNMRPFADRVAAIRSCARHEGRNAELIAGGVTILNEILAELEQNNPKRKALLEILLRCCHENKRIVVLLQKAGMRSILTQAIQLLPECIDMLRDGRLTFVSVSQLPKAMNCDIVIVPAILMANSIWALRTAIAPEIIFLTYDMERELLNWCLREVGLLQVNESLSIQGHEPAMSAGPIEPATFFLDLTSLGNAEDLEEALPQGNAPVSGPRRTLHFDDGSELTVGDSTKLQIVTDSDEPVQSRAVCRVDPGDVVLFVNGGIQQSLFELLRDRVDGQTTLSRAIEIVKAFQRALSSSHGIADGQQQLPGLKRTVSFDAHVQNLHAALVKLGSRIQRAVSVEQWITGERFGPSDPHDIRRLGIALEIPLFQTRHFEFYRAMQKVRVAHRELGKVLVRALRHLFRDRDSKSIKITVDGEEVIFYDIVDAVALKRVVHIDGVCV
jgi:hypothetical protein